MYAEGSRPRSIAIAYLFTGLERVGYKFFRSLGSVRVQIQRQFGRWAAGRRLLVPKLGVSKPLISGRTSAISAVPDWDGLCWVTTDLLPLLLYWGSGAP
jgi:hypothetical protein